MRGLNQEKEKYHYHNYISRFDGAKVKEMPGTAFTKIYSPQNNMPYSPAEAMADVFMESAKSSQNNVAFEDFFQQKVELSADQINLILGQINERERLEHDNLTSLYDDLFKVDLWRSEIPFPQNYSKDKTWSDLNRMELQLRDQIRKELKDSVRDLSFPTKDLRHGLLEFKLQNQKSKMMEDTMSLGGLDDVIEPVGSYNNMEADMHYTQNQT